MTNAPILIVDDSTNDGEFAEIILRESGFNGVFSTTKLFDAIEILKADSSIKRVVLDLGGLVRQSDNPLAALDALEAEGFSDLQIVVLTGNKNPALIQEIEKRGYQCLIKEKALDLVQKSSALPDAISNLRPAYPNLREDIHVNELFARVSRLEGQIDGILLHSGGNLQALSHDVKFIESQLNLLYDLRDRIAEFKIDREARSEEFDEFQLEFKTVSTSKNIELLILLDKAVWLLRLNQKFCDLIVFTFDLIKGIIFDNLKLIILGAITAIVVTSPLWNNWVNEWPRIQNKFRIAIEYLLR